MKKIIVIDGNSLINRAYFAMQRPMITKKGIYTQGIYGFLNMLFKILDDYKPTHMAVAWDMKSPTFRHRSFAEYKAGRKSMPMELAMEIPIMKDILTAMNIANLECEGYEADDIIGTIAKTAEAEGLDTLIITGDKDALQLATDTTKVLITKKGITEFKLYDRAAIIEEYSLTPTQFIDLKGLMGDKSDNIPGIPGVGQVTGIKLLTEFGSMENLLANSEAIKNAKLKTKVQDYEMQAAMSKKLATIFTEVPIDEKIEDFKLNGFDNDRLLELFKELEFKSFIKRLDISNNKAEIVLNKPDIFIGSFQAAVKEIENLSDEESLYIKLVCRTSHVEIPMIEALALSTRDRCFVFDQPLFMGEIFRLLKKKRFKFKGFAIKPYLYALAINNLGTFSAKADVEIGEYVLNPSRSKYEFSSIAMDRLNIDYSTEDFDDLNNIDTYFAAIAAIEELQRKELKSENLWDLYENIEMPLVEVLVDMEATGIKTEVDILKKLGKENEIEIAKLEAEIYEIAGEKFNVNSPQQLGNILFEKMELPFGKKNKTGYSTNVDVLEKLKEHTPIAEKILEYRGLTKLNSTYVSGLSSLISDDGRIRPHFMQTVAATGRISCVEPNLQNIPVKTKIGREIRKAFVADEGKVLVGADYSQIELRVLAHLSGDENLKNAFNSGRDIHKMTASKVFNLPLEDVTSLDRSKAKAINFGVIYGMSGFGLSEELGISIKAAENYIKDYFSKYAAVKEYMDNEIAKCKNLGYTLTLMGRRRFVPEISASNYMTRQFGERLAMNTPIQGSAADIIKMAMIKVHDRLKKELPSAKLILQIHDELIIEGNKEDAGKIESLLRESMESATLLSVKLECNVATSQSWFDLK